MSICKADLTDNKKAKKGQNYLNKKEFNEGKALALILQLVHVNQAREDFSKF